MLDRPRGADRFSHELRSSPSPSPTSSIDKIEETLDSYTCLALHSGEEALMSDDLEAAVQAAQRFEVAAGEWEESLPQLGGDLRVSPSD